MAVVVTMADDGRDVHPFFIPKTNAGHSGEGGFDIKTKNRKRHRTKSLGQGPATLDQSKTFGWADQLNAATSGAPLGSNASYKFTNEQNSSSGRSAHNRIRKGSNVSNLSERVGRSGDFSSCSPRPINAGVPLAEEILQPEGSNSIENPARTPPKKMLKVRSNGKLGSPKAGAAAQDAKPKRGRKLGKAGTTSKTLVASIRYGTDTQSRSSMGRKVADIFSGAASNPSPAKSKPDGPPENLKLTHPFFLGGSKRDQCHQQLAQSTDDKKAGTGGRPLTSKQGAVSPTEARVTSKPPSVPERSAIFGIGGNTFSSDHARISRFPGAMEPLWPPEGIVHVRQDYQSAETSLPTTRVFHASNIRWKMKEAEIRISKEERILTPYVDVVQAYRSDDEVCKRVHSREWREFRRPLRRILTGRELQQAVRQKIASKLPIPYHDVANRENEDGIDTPQIPQSSTHPAVHHMHKEIATSLSAFDKFECETQDWVHKYAPVCADQVLQAGREVFILRDWLKTLTVNSVGFRANETSKTRASSVSSRKATTKRKRRRPEELDGFVLSSDEEAQEMCQLTDSEDRNSTSSMLKRSIVRSRDAEDSGNGERVANAIVISGPDGCGKTAAVHAVARELGFEVFEINAGSRRSGRDILDKVGDMSRNHLVRHVHSDQGADTTEEDENMCFLSEKLKQDLDSGRQGIMKSFFKPNGVLKKSPSKRKPKDKSIPKQDLSRKRQSQKQSLILLEEVDVLFDEDKAFWATTLELLAQSKRPVIMTCTDESLLPLENMTLYAILRFTYAPEQLATDYLLLVACNEGHLLPRNAVSDLYKSKGFDLRASMTELNFFCQMAIGDDKGGLEWMLIKPASANYNDQNREPLRVVSEGTYQTGMGWLNARHQESVAELSIDQEVEMLSEAWYGWGLDLGACEAYILPSISQEKPSRTQTLQQLQVLDTVAESLSAADTFPGRIPLIHDAASLDTAQSEFTEEVRGNYIEGFSLLQADLVVDQTGVSEAIAFTIKACARRVIHIRDKFLNTTFTDDKMTSMITENMHSHRSERPSMRLDYAAVFEPIARFNKPVLGIPKGPQISIFDGSLFVITEDLAPYVRSIVSYDLRLEEQRGLLSSLNSQPGQISKRQRTTRASRAALEGGSKAHTRRERWFPKTTNFDSVLQSGGDGWQDIALKRTLAEPSEKGTELDERSSKGSIASAMENDH